MEGKPPRSSSPDREGAVDAVLWSGEHAGGPIRLPRRNGDQFVAEFNRTYGHLGWKMGPAEDPAEDPS